MSVSLKGFQERFVTFRAGEGCTAGSPVEVTAENTVVPQTAGSFTGMCAAVEGDLALVQVSGFVVLPADTAANALSLGSGSVILAEGKVKNGAGRSAIVTAIREDGMAEMILM